LCKTSDNKTNIYSIEKISDEYKMRSSQQTINKINW